MGDDEGSEGMWSDVKVNKLALHSRPFSSSPTLAVAHFFTTTKMSPKCAGHGGTVWLAETKRGVFIVGHLGCLRIPKGRSSCQSLRVGTRS